MASVLSLKTLIGKIDSKGLKGVVTMKITLISLMLALALTISLAGLARAQNANEGKNLYSTYCVTCHGDRGKGDGVAAKGLPQKPADHTNGAVMNQLDDKFLMDIISKGGGAVGKSSFMPAWGGSLNEQQIRDIIAYIRTIAVPAYRSGPGGK
jgi:mono/diheme cytochrome c family protein